MSDRLTDDELFWLEGLRAGTPEIGWEPDALTVHAECTYPDPISGQYDPASGPDSIVVREDSGEKVAVLEYDAGGDYVARLAVAAYNALPALLAELREHRAREAAHRAALDTLVDGDDR